MLAKTNITGLDEILGGGLPRNHIYLVQGDPGVGKTTVGLQFLLAGIDVQDVGVYVTLSETKAEIEAVAASHGWSVTGMHLFELSAIAQSQDMDNASALFDGSEIELQDTTKVLLAYIDEKRPKRVVIDSLSELRLLAQTPLRYRRQILALKQFFVERDCTVLLLDDNTAESTDQQAHSLAHGVIVLDQVAPAFGDERRRVRVAKLRGVNFAGGYHDLAIRTGGIEVYPRLRPDNRMAAAPSHGALASGVQRLDALLGGGLDRGTSTLVMGPAGSGKSTLTSQYAFASAEQGERASVLSFDEGQTTWVKRATALGMDVEKHMRGGLLGYQHFNPGAISPGEFSHGVKQEVVKKGARLIVIDSLSGYMNAMRDERALSMQMHELLSFLGNHGVITMLVLAQHGMIGSMDSPVDVSYIADSVVLLRFFESRGSIRRAISMLKKRSGPHESAIREYSFGDRGLKLSEPLANFEGVLTGVPRFTGRDDSLGTP